MKERLSSLPPTCIHAYIQTHTPQTGAVGSQVSRNPHTTLFPLPHTGTSELSMGRVAAEPNPAAP